MVERRADRAAFRSGLRPSLTATRSAPTNFRGVSVLNRRLTKICISFESLLTIRNFSKFQTTSVAAVGSML